MSWIRRKISFSMMKSIIMCIRGSRSIKHEQENTARKVSKYRVFSGPYFPAFGLNTEIYGVNLRIQSECGKIRTRKNSVFGHFFHSEHNAEESPSYSEARCNIT